MFSGLLYKHTHTQPVTSPFAGVAAAAAAVLVLFALPLCCLYFTERKPGASLTDQATVQTLHCTLLSTTVPRKKESLSTAQEISFSSSSSSKKTVWLFDLRRRRWRHSQCNGALSAQQLL